MWTTGRTAHDYVGNQANDTFADNEDFAAGETTCQNQGDKSSYYWPVLRLQDGTQEFDTDPARSSRPSR